MDDFFDKQRYYIGHFLTSFIFGFLNIVDNIWESVIFVVKEKE